MSVESAAFLMVDYPEDEATMVRVDHTFPGSAQVTTRNDRIERFGDEPRLVGPEGC
jgi:hypothetical protein